MNDQSYVWKMGVLLIGLLILLIGCDVDQLKDYTKFSDQLKMNSSPSKDRMPPGKLIVHFIDVGQGDSTLIEFPNGVVVLIDCGDNNKGIDVVNYIKSKNIALNNLLIATHPDADHIGGCDKVLQQIKTDMVIDNGEFSNTITYRDYIAQIDDEAYKKALTDSIIDIDPEVFTEIIVPYDTPQGKNSDSNDNSVLFKMRYGNTSFLFMGDCEEECEKDVINDGITADVLKVGHHGSKTSSSDAFLAEVQPKISVISVGEGNKYGHPRTEVLNRLNNTEILRTDQLGTIVLESDGIAIKQIK